MTMKSIIAAGDKVIELLQLIQKVSGIGGQPAATVLEAIHKASSAALEGTDDDVAGAITALRQHLVTDEALDDADARALEDQRWPDSTPTNPNIPAPSKK